mgnify:FL=1
MSNTVKLKYQVHKAGAKRRGISFDLTFDEWNDIWVSSGKWDKRGVGLDKFCMCRFGDKGGYQLGNIFIGEFYQNSKEANLGRIHSAERNLEKSLLRKGKKQSLSHIASRAEALKGVKQTSERIQKRVESYIKTCEQRKEIYQGE